MMTPYKPKSDFLNAIISEYVPLSGSPMADENMQRLIAMTRDDDVSNRDWATLLLSQEEADTPEIRAALLNAINDTDPIVRAEALLGIAQRDTQLALPLALVELSGDQVSMAVLEAAEIIADPALVESLRPWTEPSDNEWLDELAWKALRACEGVQFSA